jgi:hypothetical protein
VFGFYLQLLIVTFLILRRFWLDVIINLMYVVHLGNIYV